jgi:hypothetical protein
MDGVVAAKLRNQPRFLLVGLFASELYRSWLESRCRSLGFTDRKYGEYEGIRVFLFERSP